MPSIAAMSVSYGINACGACGATGATPLATSVELERELAALRHLHPPGAERDRITFTQAPPLALVRCDHCGTLYRNPAERRLAQVYEDEEQDATDLAHLYRLQRPVFDRLAESLTRLRGAPGRVLEIGSYTGAFLDAATGLGWQASGLDVNPTAVRYARDRGLDVVAGTIESAAGGWDAIAFWNCFDQLEDPRAAALAAYERLRPGGWLALRVPNGRYYETLRRWPFAGRLLARENLLAFPYRFGFTATGLERLLDATGFVTAAVHGAAVLPAAADGRLGPARLLDVVARGVRPYAGAPWLEVYANRS